MKIDSSTIGMESARSYRSTKTAVSTFSIKEYQGSLSFDDYVLSQSGENDNEDKVSSNQNNKEETGGIFDSWQNLFGYSVNRVNENSRVNNTAQDIREISIKYIFQLLFSRRRERFKDMFSDFKSSVSATQDNNMNSQGGTDVPVAGNGTLGVTIKQLSYSNIQIFEEQEETSFSTTGTVRTADGREINFNIDVGMSRSFTEKFIQEIDLSKVTLCDPLVINMDSNVASVSDQKIYFDIDADGTEDEISALGRGSGFLALDKNEDGIINDGSELFGTKSGDGFGDLAEYDEDGNGWIDENDAVWSKLQIWTVNEAGKPQLYHLEDKGIGAICLANVSTEHTLKDDSGNTNAVIKNSGIFLYENGNVGTIQHVDMAKYAGEA